MTTEEWVESAIEECKAGLREHSIDEVGSLFEKASISPSLRHEALVSSAKTQSASPSLLMLRDRVTAAGLEQARFPLERRILLEETLAALPKISALPVDETVQQLFCKEFISIAQPTAEAVTRFGMDGYTFIAYAKTVLLQRFPAGHYQWEISGFPKRWILKVPAGLLPRTLRFVLLETRGFEPWFVSHMRATGAGMPFLVESEFRKSFFRMALALEKQPHIRALMAQSWLHSPETHRVSPHLAFLNRIFEEAGGLVTNLGPAEENDGFTTGNRKRADLYRQGLYKPTNGVVVCSRKQAIAWAKKHADLEMQITVK